MLKVYIYATSRIVAKMRVAIGFEFSRSEYNNVYPGISERTAKNDIQKMIQLNFCEKTGAGSSTKYRIIAR